MGGQEEEFALRLKFKATMCHLPLTAAGRPPPLLLLLQRQQWQLLSVLDQGLPLMIP